MSFLPACPKQVLRVGAGNAKSDARSTRDALEIWDTASIGRKVQHWLERDIKRSLSVPEAFTAGRLPSASLGYVLTAGSGVSSEGLVVE